MSLIRSNTYVDDSGLILRTGSNGEIISLSYIGTNAEKDYITIEWAPVTVNGVVKMLVHNENTIASDGNGQHLSLNCAYVYDTVVPTQCVSIGVNITSTDSSFVPISTVYYHPAFDTTTGEITYLDTQEVEDPENPAVNAWDTTKTHVELVNGASYDYDMLGRVTSTQREGRLCNFIRPLLRTLVPNNRSVFTTE